MRGRLRLEILLFTTRPRATEELKRLRAEMLELCMLQAHFSTFLILSNEEKAAYGRRQERINMLTQNIAELEGECRSA